MPSCSSSSGNHLPTYLHVPDPTYSIIVKCRVKQNMPSQAVLFWTFGLRLPLPSPRFIQSRRTHRSARSPGPVPPLPSSAARGLYLTMENYLGTQLAATRMAATSLLLDMGTKKSPRLPRLAPNPAAVFFFFFFFFFFGTTTTCPNTTTTAIPTTVHRHLLHSTSVQIPHQPTNLTPISPSPTTPLLTRSHLSPLTYLPPLVPTLPLKIHLPSPSSHGRRRRSSHHIHIVYRIPSPKPRNILAPITQLERLQTTCTVPCESAPAAAISTISVWLALRTWSRWLRHSGQAGNAACHSRAKLRREEAAR
ncbi:hypothetical protein BKA81DRAFT_35335 [Phyllosticta paracitricarpa]